MDYHPASMQCCLLLCPHLPKLGAKKRHHQHHYTSDQLQVSPNQIHAQLTGYLVYFHREARDISRSDFRHQPRRGVVKLGPVKPKGSCLDRNRCQPDHSPGASFSNENGSSPAKRRISVMTQGSSVKVLCTIGFFFFFICVLGSDGYDSNDKRQQVEYTQHFDCTVFEWT